MRRIYTTRILLRRCWLVAVNLLLLSGVIYRITAYQLKLSVQSPIVLAVPLSSFPVRINGWLGKDVPVPEHIQRMAGNDDFLYRIFVHESTGQWAGVYIAYSGRPRTMLGHRPEVCYVAGGWVHDDSIKSNFPAGSDKQIPCLLHRFHKPSPGYEEVVVLNFYVLNGRVTRSESGFSGLGWRTPNIAGNPARFVAQVQISSVLENSVRAIAKDITGRILSFFPDENGVVQAADDFRVETGAGRMSR